MRWNRDGRSAGWRRDTGIERFDGDRFSGGEQERVVLARAWLSAADVMVLGEAMTAVDAAEEERIESWLRATGRTVVAISHRLDVTLSADVIVYFDGRKTHCGPHRELISRCPEYRELVAFAAAP